VRNKEHLVKKFIAMALAAAGCALATGAANAGNVYWSVGINVPPVGTVVSNAPVYVEPAPVYVPAPVYAPAPVYVPAPPVVYAPAPVVYAPPPPVVVVPRYVRYRPAPVYYQRPVVLRPADFARPYGTWQGHRDEYGTYYRDGRWNDERRYKH